MLNTNGKYPALQHIATHQICDASILVLYIQWHRSLRNVLGVTLSDGRVCLCKFSDDAFKSDASFDLDTITQHDLEPWCLAFTSDSLLSGGDDMFLHRASFDTNGASDAVVNWKDRRLHSAGITFILPIDDDLFMTGSYDDHIRLISAPVNGRRQVLAQENLGGGAWRLQLLDSEPAPSSRLLILASCMYAGTRIVQLNLGNDKDKPAFKVLARFEEHESMNYASGVLRKHESEHTIVSTSFYDRRICVWSFKWDA